jgi:hypothetical protein
MPSMLTCCTSDLKRRFDFFRPFSEKAGRAGNQN